MKYYYTPDAEEDRLSADGLQIISHFLITPADYYDVKGFLSDRYNAVPEDHLPPGFVRCADSKFEFKGTRGQGLRVLRLARGFIRRDMAKEIAENYD